MITARFVGGPLDGKLTKIEASTPPLQYRVPGLPADTKAVLMDKIPNIRIIEHVYHLKAQTRGVAIYAYKKNKKHK